MFYECITCTFVFYGTITFECLNRIKLTETKISPWGKHINLSYCSREVHVYTFTCSHVCVFASFSSCLYKGQIYALLHFNKTFTIVSNLISLLHDQIGHYN